MDQTAVRCLELGLVVLVSVAPSARCRFIFGKAFDVDQAPILSDDVNIMIIERGSGKRAGRLIHSRTSVSDYHSLSNRNISSKLLKTIYLLCTNGYLFTRMAKSGTIGQ